MALPEDFILDKYVPTKQDFEDVLDAKSTGAPLQSKCTTGPNNNRPYYYKKVRILLVAILLGWPEAVESLKKTLTTYDGFDIKQLKEILIAMSKPPYTNAYIDSFEYYKKLNVKAPENIGNIQIRVKNQNASYFRLITYDMTYATGGKSGTRRHLYFGKKVGDEYKIVVRGADGGEKSSFDEPVFATIQEAKDFAVNVQKNPMKTKTNLGAWKYVISDKLIDYGWDWDTQKKKQITDLSKAAKVDTICGPAYIFINSKCYVENMKGSINMNTLNEASLSYPEQREKMRKLDAGTRGFNVAAASYEKVRYNYRLCVSEGFLRAKDYIESELRKIGRLDWIKDLMPQQPKPAPQPQPQQPTLPVLTTRDFHYADFAFVRNNIDEDVINDVADLENAVLKLIYAIVLKRKNLVDELRKLIVTKWNIKMEDLKKTITDALNDQAILQDITNIVNFKESNESLEEDTEKIKAGKWVNKGKEGTHGTFKTKKAADAQRKAMFANGFSEEYINKLAEVLQDPKYTDVKEYLNNVKPSEELEEKVEKHDTLNPVLFDANNKLLPEVREKLLAIAKEFTDGLEEDEIKFNLKDIKLVGSNCSYNYNENSDLDLHLVAETESLNCPDNLYPLLYSAYRSIFNNKFDPIIHGIPVELFVETEETEQIDNKEITEERQKSALNSAGIYSVLNDEWIKEPEQADIPEIDQAELDKLVQPWIDKYNEIKLNPTVEAIEKYIEDIYEIRKAGIARSEYDLDNLTFKEVRGLGYLDELKDLRNELRSKELSLESLEERLDERTRREYQIKISQIAHDQAIVDENNNFSIHLVKESDVDQILRGLRQLDFVYDLNKIAGKFDFSHPTFTGNQPRYWTIRGRIKEKEDL